MEMREQYLEEAVENLEKFLQKKGWGKEARTEAGAEAEAEGG